jgi:branched-chain amino acid transport system substrate-binding protein
MKKNAIVIVLVLIALAAVFAIIQKQRSAAVTGTTVLVIAPLTGPGAALGASSQLGMRLALDDLGQKSAHLKLNFQDSKTDPKTALTLLASREIHANSRIVISEMSQVTRALVQPAQEHNVLLLATAVGVPKIGQGSTNFVRVNIMSDAIAPPLARFAAKQHTKIAILHLNDDYGRANRDLFKKTYEAAGGTVVLIEPFETDPAIVGTLVAKVRASGTSACFVAGYGPAYPVIFRAFKELAPSIQLYADIGLANAPVFRAVGTAAEGVFLAATDIDEFPATTQPGKALFEKFSRTKPGERPDYIVAFSYDTITVLADALGAVPSGDPHLLREYLLKKQFNGLGGRFHFDPNTGDSIYDDLAIFKVQSGHILRVSNASTKESR